MNGECKRFEALIVDYAVGELDRSAAEIVEGHLESCPRCLDALKEVRQMVSGLSRHEMMEPSAVVSGAVREGVREKVFGRQRIAAAVSDVAASFVRRPLLAGASALVLVAAVVLSLLLHGPQPGPTTPIAQPPIFRTGVNLMRFEDYVAVSRQLMRLINGRNAAEILACYNRDDWTLLIGPAMRLREMPGHEGHQTLLEDFEGLYKQIMEQRGTFRKQDVERIRKVIADKKLMERTKEAIESWMQREDEGLVPSRGPAGSEK